VSEEEAMATRRKKPEADETPSVDEDTPTARSFWSGTISFGLVTVPVELYAGQRSARGSLRMLADDGSPLSRRYYSPGADEPLDGSEIERAYEMPDGQLVTVTDEELEGLMPEQSRDIDLRRFVDAASIDPRFFDRSYFLAPAGKSTTAYRLLAETMERTKKVGIATFVMRGKQYVVAISAEDGLLRAETLRFADELRAPDELGLPEPKKVSAEAVKKMRAAVKKLAKPTFATTEIKDESWKQVEKLVEKKRKKHQDVVEPPEGAAEEGEGAEVIDLLEVLKQSLARDQSGSAAKKRPARKRA
jgi:DNA end-binding protein Ku